MQTKFNMDFIFYHEQALNTHKIFILNLILVPGMDKMISSSGARF